MPIPLIWWAGVSLVSFGAGFFTGSSLAQLLKWLASIGVLLAAAYYFFFIRKGT
jgi:hypothetical protein